MSKRQKRLLGEIKKEAIRLDWEEAFGGKAYGNKHLHRVNKIVRFLMSYEGGDEFVVLAGAWVHDVVLVSGLDDNDRKIAKFTLFFLQRFVSLKKKERARIVACAVGHETGGKHLSLEAKLVHDADVLDKSGMLGVIRHIWKMTNMIENRVLFNKRDLHKLEEHLMQREKKMFTKTAQILAEALNREKELFFAESEFAVKTMKQISELAKSGLISDEIAKKIVEEIDNPCVFALERQLSCEYLE